MSTEDRDWMENNKVVQREVREKTAKQCQISACAFQHEMGQHTLCSEKYSGLYLTPVWNIHHTYKD